MNPQAFSLKRRAAGNPIIPRPSEVGPALGSERPTVAAAPAAPPPEAAPKPAPAAAPAPVFPEATRPRPGLEALDLQLDQDGGLIVSNDETTLALGDFLRMTEGVWRPCWASRLGKEQDMSLHDEIRSAQIRAGEDAVIRNLERLGLAPAPTTDDGQMFVLAMANRVCQHLPKGWELRLCMENGAAWVSLIDEDGDEMELPDSADKSLEQQVNDALCVAREW